MSLRVILLKGGFIGFKVEGLNSIKGGYMRDNIGEYYKDY